MTDDPENIGTGPDADRCPWCRGTGIVINGDGRPGWRHPRLCFHNHRWRVMTEPELERHKKRLERLNANPTPPTVQGRRTSASETAAPRWVESTRGPAWNIPPPRKDIDDD